MNIDPITLARARLALQQAAREYLFDRNVSLIDLGNPEHNGQIAADELAIRIHVRQKLSGAALESAADQGLTAPIPPYIGGFPTDVPQGIYKAHQWANRPAPNPRAAHADPMRGGVSISDAWHNTYGTLGCRVLDRASGAAMLLSNWHVLAADWGDRTGQRICQPGRLDGGTIADTIATLTRDAMRANLDAAVATLIDGDTLINDQLGLGPITGVAAPTLGAALTKSGRRTGVTYGRVSAVEGIMQMRYGNQYRLIRGVIVIDQFDAGPVSGPGDSGSCWLDLATNQAVGLHFAGSDEPERALALDMQQVLDVLAIDIDTGQASEQRYRWAR